MPGFNINGNGVGPSNTVESSRKHRFVIRILDPLSPDLLFFAYKVSIPPVEIDRAVMHHKQEEIYLPGKHRYQLCEISFYRVHDGEGDQAAREIYNWWANSLLDVANSRILDNEFDTFRKRTAEIFILSSSGAMAYTYILEGTWVHKITPEAFDFGDSKIADIVLTLCVDKVREANGTSPSTITDACIPADTFEDGPGEELPGGWRFVDGQGQPIAEPPRPPSPPNVPVSPPSRSSPGNSSSPGSSPGSSSPGSGPTGSRFPSFVTVRGPASL